jgi:hypothetical protein
MQPTALFAPQILCSITPENATTLTRTLRLALSASEFSFAQLFLLDQRDEQLQK